MIALSSILIVLAVFLYQFFSEQEFIFRISILLGGLVLGTILALKSLPGKNFIIFFRDSIHEMRRVVWPTKKETFQTVLIVFVFVLLVSIFLWIADKSFEWILYDLVLGWK